MALIDDIMKRDEERRKAEELSKEEMDDLRIALNSVAASDHGRLVLKRLVKICRVFTQPKSLNPADLMVDRIMQSVYLTIRPLLSPENRTEIERG